MEVYPQMAQQFKIVTCSIPAELYTRMKEAQEYSERKSTNEFLRRMIGIYVDDVLKEKTGIPEQSTGIPESEPDSEKGIPGN